MFGQLQGKRILVTQADEFMGPMLCEVLAEHGAEVLASAIPLSERGAAESLVTGSGEMDVLLPPLLCRRPRRPPTK